MPINRAPFNALIDDTGNGTSGSVWNKAAIQSVILDPADAAYAAASVATAAWQPVTFNVANFWAGVTAGMVAANRYVILQNKTLLWMVQLAAAPAPAATPYLSFTIPGGVAMSGCFSPVAFCTENGANMPALLFFGNSGIMQALKVAGGNWTGTISIYYTAILSLV